MPTLSLELQQKKRSALKRARAIPENPDKQIKSDNNGLFYLPIVFYGLFFILMSLPLSATVGIGDGCCENCEGYEICFGDMLQDKAASPSIAGYEQQIPKIEMYYQYKQHFIGKYRDGYFIFNTQNGTVRTFQDEKAWEKAQKADKLIPVYWTDWIKPRSHCGTEALFTLMSILFFVLGIPYLLWLGYMVGGYFYPHWKKSRGRVFVILIAWTVLIVFLIKLQRLGSF